MKTQEQARADMNLTENEKKAVKEIIELFLMTREIEDVDMVTLFRIYVNKVAVDNSLTFTCANCRTACRDFWMNWFKSEVGAVKYYELLNMY